MAINSPYGITFAEDLGLVLGNDVDPILFKESVEIKNNSKQLQQPKLAESLAYAGQS